MPEGWTESLDPRIERSGGAEGAEGCEGMFEDGGGLWENMFVISDGVYGDDGT